MKYKTTYFVLSLNKEISYSGYIINECIIKDELIAKYRNLEDIVKTEVKEYIDSLKIRVPVKLDYVPVNPANGYKEVPLDLTEEEKKDLIEKYAIDNISKWEKIIRIERYKSNFSMEKLCHSKNVKLLQEYRKRLSVIENVNNRYTKEDEERLNSHLNEVASEGWKLHSMNPIHKGLYGPPLFVDNDVIGFGHDVQEGFVLVWEKD